MGAILEFGDGRGVMCHAPGAAHPPCERVERADFTDCKLARRCMWPGRQVIEVPAITNDRAANIRRVFVPNEATAQLVREHLGGHPVEVMPELPRPVDERGRPHRDLLAGALAAVCRPLERAIAGALSVEPVPDDSGLPPGSVRVVWRGLDHAIEARLAHDGG